MITANYNSQNSHNVFFNIKGSNSPLAYIAIYV